MGVPRQCFRNAVRLALRKPRFYTYVEGYAINTWVAEHPVAHAWCVDPDLNGGSPAVLPQRCSAGSPKAAILHVRGGLRHQHVGGGASGGACVVRRSGALRGRYHLGGGRGLLRRAFPGGVREADGRSEERRVGKEC